MSSVAFAGGVAIYFSTAKVEMVIAVVQDRPVEPVRAHKHSKTGFRWSFCGYATISMCDYSCLDDDISNPHGRSSSPRRNLNLPNIQNSYSPFRRGVIEVRLVARTAAFPLLLRFPTPRLPSVCCQLGSSLTLGPDLRGSRNQLGIDGGLYPRYNIVDRYKDFLYCGVWLHQGCRGVPHFFHRSFNTFSHGVNSNQDLSVTITAPQELFLQTEYFHQARRSSDLRLEDKNFFMFSPRVFSERAHFVAQVIFLPPVRVLPDS